MRNVTANMAMSVDGFVAGLYQSLDNPFGEGAGDRLHRRARCGAEPRVPGIRGRRVGPASLGLHCDDKVISPLLRSHFA